MQNRNTASEPMTTDSKSNGKAPEISLDRLPVAVFSCDTKGIITYYNNAAENIFGSAPKIGKDHWYDHLKIFDNNLKKITPANFLGGFHEELSEDSIEIYIERTDGIRYHLLSQPQPMFENDGRLCGYINTLIELNDVDAAKDSKDNVENNAERYYKMIDEIKEYSIILLDAEGTILNWNQGAKKIQGYSSKEIIGKNFSVFYSTDDREEALPEKLLQMAAERGNATQEGWRVKKDGSRFWGSVTITALHSANGEVIGYSNVTTDLSDSKAAQETQRRHLLELEHKNEELKRSEERYHQMIAEVEDYAIILLDTQGNILNWNKGAEKIKGYTPEEAVGRHFSIFYLAEDVEKGLPQSLMAKAREVGKATHEGWRVKKDGTNFWGSIVITALHDSENNIIGFSKVTRDLTERKMLEEKQDRIKAELLYKNELLQRSEERYHKMIAEVEDYAIILLDLDGNILNWNKGAENIKGYSEKEIIGKNFRIFYLEEDRKAGLPEKLMATAIKNNRATHEGWRVRKDGTRFWGSIVITALHDDENNIIGFSKVTRDLTQKKEADDQMVAYAREIEYQNQQLEEYAYVASHDLQEPLRKIRIYCELLENSLDKPEMARKNLDKITSSASRMATLIKDVLTYSQLSHTGNHVVETDLGLIVEHIKDDFAMLLEQRNGQVHHSGLQPICAIPIQMHQLFSNLINNGLKFSDRQPRVEIVGQKVSGKDVEPFVNYNREKEYLRITISDNGIGFDQAYEEQIFKMFQRLDDQRKGTGIGLALCKKIVENHHGDVSVKSVRGEGTTFTILLPVK